MPTNLAPQQAMMTSGLSQPIPPPTMPGSNFQIANPFQGIAGTNPGMNYGMPFSTGSTIADSGTMDGDRVNTANPGSVRAQDFNQTGSNVAGLYGRDYSPEEAKTYIPPEKDNQEEQTNMFLKADEEGYTSTEDTRADMAADWGAKGAGIGTIVAPGFGTAVGGTIGAGLGYIAGKKEGEQVEGGIKGARAAKRADRTADRKARKEKGLKGAKKRRARRFARRERKESWKDYKDEMTLRDVE